MTNFASLASVTTSKGSVVQIERNGKVLWCLNKMRYVSLGDSIASGYEIDWDWQTDYGTGSEYGMNGNATTAIVPDTYTDLIRNELAANHGTGRVSATSYAQSGDTVEDLLEKLTHTAVINELKKATIVTICIGANDVLGPALGDLETYITEGDSALAGITANVNTNLAKLADDSNANSYMALFKRLTEINPSAKYVFTTVYNPYKYLWVPKGTWGNEYNDSFFAPVFKYVPQLTTLGVEWDKELKKALLNTSVLTTLFTRINGIDALAEDYVTRLNAVLRDRFNAYNNPNFYLAETKALYDSFPDRTVTATKHYNDLVNVEYTRGYDTAQMSWSALWYKNTIKDINGNLISSTVCNDAETFWDVLLDVYMDSAFDVDYEGMAGALFAEVGTEVILPDVDPHPEAYGHYLMKRAFAEALGWAPLDHHKVTYIANGGSGSTVVQDIPGVDGLPVWLNINANGFKPATGYYFTGWNTAADGSGTTYTAGQYTSISGDLTLYAQWSNIYSIRYRHTNCSSVYTDSDDGRRSCYCLTIGGTEMRRLGTFGDDDGDTYYYPYGTQVTVMVNDYTGGSYSFAYDNRDCRIYYNGTQKAVGQPATWTFSLGSNVDIDFRAYTAGSWATFDAQAWWDCHITT